MKPEIPRTENEFNRLMKETDERLKDRNIPIYNRPIHAPIEIARKLGISIPLVPTNGQAIAGTYYGDSLTAHIHNWYQKWYGERLNVQMAIGSGIILIRKDAWRVIYPLIFGTVLFVCDKDLEKYRNSPSFTTDGTPPLLNVLHLVEDLPGDYAKSLTKPELRSIKQTFLSNLTSLSYFDIIKKRQFMKEAKADLGVAVDSFFTDPAQYSQSKWASLQFSEKILKCFLLGRKTKFPKSHILSDLYNLASKNGLPAFSKELITQVQCSAGVRYGEESVSLEEAALAHYSSLGICFFTARAIALFK